MRKPAAKRQPAQVVALKPPPRATPCPICAQPAEKAFRPFCSKHCADVDLGRWLGEGYRIPDREDEGFGEGRVEGLADAQDDE